MKDRIFIILDSKEKKLLDCYDDGIFIFEKYFILISFKNQYKYDISIFNKSYYITLRLSCKLL